MANLQGEQPKYDPKADCEVLMNSVIPFAEQMLSKCGEISPFGGAMRPSGEVVAVAGYDGDEHPQSSDVIRLIKEGFIRLHAKANIKQPRWYMMCGQGSPRPMISPTR
jgi:hypothetical protein